MNMDTTNKVQTGEPVTGTSTSTSTSTSTGTTWHCPYTQPKAEQGWECPRCGRINAPWVRQCDCSRSNWTITSDDWTYKPDWWKDVICNSDTFKVHPDSTIYQVGGSDYWNPTIKEWKNVEINTQSNQVEPNVTAWNCTNPNIAVNDFTTYRTDIPKTYTTVANSIDNIQKQLDKLKETK